MRSLLSFLILAAALTGCIGAQEGVSSQANEPAQEARVPTPHAVVAVIDTGIQPYHEVFAAPPGWIPPPVPGMIRLGDEFRSRVLEDVSAWNGLEPGRLYYFEGTRVLAISKFMPYEFPGYDNPHVIYDDFGVSGHGTATAGIVAQASPHATIVMVEAERLLTDAYDWILNQGWIDVISVSQGRIANTPGNPTVHPDPEAAVLQEAVSDGKLAVLAAGNEPTPVIMGDGGPPWVISVGGAEVSTRGETVIASKMVDVVSNFTSDRLADKRDARGYWRAGGTSFSAPVVAGTLAETIYRLRASFADAGLHDGGPLVNGPGGVITNADVRAAMNASAVYWDLRGYDPTNYTITQPFEILAATAPILPTVPNTPVGPWIQMGWGYIGPESVPDLLGILADGKTPPQKPREAVEYMARVAELKAAFWDVWQRS